MHAVLVLVHLLLVTPITSSWWVAGSQLNNVDLKSVYKNTRKPRGRMIEPNKNETIFDHINHGISTGHYQDCKDHFKQTITPVVMDPRNVCKKTRRLRGRMIKMCKNEELLDQITQGLSRGQQECQYQFRHRRWNCTSSKRSIKNVLLRDTRETSFVNAILAAGVTYQVTRACAMGLLKCSCVRNKRHKGGNNKNEKKLRTISAPDDAAWKYEDCDDNINFGLRKSEDFMDARYRRRSDMNTLVKLHNYAAGRLAIKNYMREECKCHGLSGSCTLKTCWRKMPCFREVGNRLKERFDGAAKVIAGNDGRSFIPEGETIKTPGKRDLVYSEDTPNFCSPNSTLGSFGTQGRMCNATSQGEEGCGILCCNRGYETSVKSEEENCKCKFHWCCEVKCERCKVERKISTCL